MKIWLKRILISLVVVLIVALVGIAIFLLTFDPNAYKSRIEGVVYERYGRTLSINGEIELSLFPRIGLAVQDMSLSDRDSEDIFASIDSARVAVAIWPLLFERLVVDHVAVTGFKAWVVRDTQGRYNFSDLVRGSRYSVAGLRPTSPLSLVAQSGVAQPSLPFSAEPVRSSVLGAVSVPGTAQIAEPGAHDAALPLQSVVLAAPAVERAEFQIDIAGLELKGGEIHFLDRKTGSTGRIEQLDVNTGRVTFDQPFDVALKGKLVGEQPHADTRFEGQALVQIDPLERTYSAQRVNFLLDGTLGDLNATSATLKGNLAYSEFSQMFSASSLELLVRGDIQGDKPVDNLDASLIVPQLRIDRSEAEFQVTRLALRAKGEQQGANIDIAVDAPSLSISPEIAKGEPVVGTFRSSERNNDLGVSVEMTGLGGDAFDLTLQELKVDSTQKRGDRLVTIQMSSPAAWSPFSREGGLSAMKGDVRIEDVTLPGGRFQFPFIGSSKADLYQDELSAAINAVLGGNKIDFNLAVSQLSDPHFVFDLTADSVDLNTLFPPPKEPAPSAADEEASEEEASDEDASTEPAAKTPAPAEPTRQFDWSFLDSAHVQGNIQANALKAGGLELSALKAAISAQDGILHIRDVTAELYGGTLESSVSFSSEHDVTIGLAAVNVDLRPLGQAFMHSQRLLGRADFEVDIVTQGVTTPALVSALDGVVVGHVRDGAWVGLNLSQTIVEVKDVLRNAFSGQLPKIASRFDASRRTEFDSLDLRLELQKGQGSIQNLQLKSPTVDVSSRQPASIDLVNQQLEVTLDVKGKSTLATDAPDFSVLDGVTVPVRISGPFNAPTYQVQWQGIQHPVVKDAIEGGLLDILSQLSGSGGGSFLFPLTDEPDATKRDPLKSIGDALKGLLGQ